MSEALAKIEGESKPIVQEAKTFLIKDDESFMETGFRLKSIKGFLEQANGIFDPQIEAAHQSHKIALEQKKKFIAPMVEADKLYRRKRSDYEIELERQAEEARRKADEAAKAEEDRKKKELEEAAIKAEAILGDPAFARELREAAQQVVVESAAPAIVTQKAPEVAGFASAKDWDISVTNPMLLIQAIACGDVVVDLGALITWKTGELKAYLKRTNKEEIPGCLVEKKKVQKVF
jgi:hypothetical protein